MKLVVKKTKWGRGVFTQETIRAGRLVHSADLIMIPASEAKLIEKTILDRYVYDAGRGQLCLALGLGSLFNHSTSPNLKAELDFKNKLIRFYAIELIPAKTQLLIDYGYQP